MTVALREDHFFDDSPKAIELRRLWSENGHSWTALIRQGQEQGDFNPELNPKMVAFGILGMCNWLARWFAPLKGAVSLDEVIRHYVANTPARRYLPCPWTGRLLPTNCGWR